jgi:hypothetical protein
MLLRPKNALARSIPEKPVEPSPTTVSQGMDDTLFRAQSADGRGLLQQEREAEAEQEGGWADEEEDDGEDAFLMQLKKDMESRPAAPTTTAAPSSSMTMDYLDEAMSSDEEDF